MYSLLLKCLGKRVRKLNEHFFGNIVSRVLTYAPLVMKRWFKTTCHVSRIFDPWIDELPRHQATYNYFLIL